MTKFGYSITYADNSQCNALKNSDSIEAWAFASKPKEQEVTTIYNINRYVRRT